MTEITLPWPPQGLSPNSRLHWRKLAQLKKQYREACGWQVKAQGVRPVQATGLHVHLVFYPPDRRHRDWDNMLASVKAGLDGMADALGVDDKLWTLSFEVATEIGGMVKVRIRKPAGREFFAPTGAKTEPHAV